MSVIAKLLRGKQYHEMRDRDGNIPVGIRNNKDKMSDLDAYLDSQVKEEVKEEVKISKKKKKGD